MNTEDIKEYTKHYNPEELACFMAGVEYVRKHYDEILLMYRKLKAREINNSPLRTYDAHNNIGGDDE